MGFGRLGGSQRRFAHSFGARRLEGFGAARRVSLSGCGADPDRSVGVTKNRINIGEMCVGLKHLTGKCLVLVRR